MKLDGEKGQIEIKQLRPLVSTQPWGIFFLNFPGKDMPVTVLRRILGKLARKKRASQNPAERAVWDKNDLLFIASFGKTGERQLSFAHFQDRSDVGDLPALRVLGWDGQNTIRRLSYTNDLLKSRLCWPDDPRDLESWRQRWSGAFTEGKGESVATSKAMAQELARLARQIRARANELLDAETEQGPLRQLHTAFREALIHDLKPDDFADMYAQTIAYGLLSAQIARASGALTADDAALMAPATNPFLQELLTNFLQAGGRKGGMDFDELGVNEVVEMLREANMEAVLRDFDDRNPQEDPVIHFYELFLKEYDAKKRMQRGVTLLREAVRVLEERLEEAGASSGASAVPGRPTISANNKKVFIVHGHDSGPKEAVARLLTSLGFEPIILHEQANKGRTIIEKFEANADVGFTVVILTPDDVGGLKDGPQESRARQNVILELGYFTGRLTRERVCALKVGNLEVPSDILGVLWTDFDAAGAWRASLGKELQAAGYSIDWNVVMG